MSSEVLLRVAGPALVVVMEVEAPTRIVPVVFGADDEDRLGRWVEDSPAREHVAAWAFAAHELDGGARRQQEWVRALAGDGGGIVEAAKELLAKLTEAEARARENQAGVRRFESLRRSLRLLAQRD